MALPDIEQRDLSSVRVVINGGEKMPIPLIERIQRVFPSAWFADAYGLTETVSGDTFLDRESIVTKIGSVGRPCLYLELDVWDEDGASVPPGEQGEIVMRGPKVFKGYWQDSDATAAAFTGGRFHTGDIGVRDADGYLYIVDRLKDMIVSGGENIASSEIERVLYEHDSVLEAAVIGRPDDRWGEVPVAFVVLRQNASATPDELVAHCQAQLARFKVPRGITFVEALPRNPSGKVLKREPPRRRVRTLWWSTPRDPYDWRRHDSCQRARDRWQQGMGLCRSDHRSGGARLPPGRVLPGGRSRSLRVVLVHPTGEGRAVAGRAGREWPAVQDPHGGGCLIDPSTFNGTVIVLWNNVSAGYENFAGGDSAEVYEGGFAYIAVSAQRVGIHGQPDNPQGLRDWDPDGTGHCRSRATTIVRHLHAGGQSGRSRSTPRRPRTPWTVSRCDGSSRKVLRNRRRAWLPISTASSRSRGASTPFSS